MTFSDEMRHFAYLYISPADICSFCVNKSGWDAHMSDPLESERITIRLDADDLKMIDEFISDSNEFSNRSQLARAAVRAYIEMREGGREGTNAKPNEILVQIPSLVLDTVRQLVAEGVYSSTSEAVADAARHEFLHEEHVEVLKKDANRQGTGFKIVPGA
jgi:metal-responsive CopG/Arc/MetJ family transcriptional regulator